MKRGKETGTEGNVFNVHVVGLWKIDTQCASMVQMPILHFLLDYLKKNPWHTIWIIAEREWSADAHVAWRVWERVKEACISSLLLKCFLSYCEKLTNHGHFIFWTCQSLKALGRWVSMQYSWYKCHSLQKERKQASKHGDYGWSQQMSHWIQLKKPITAQQRPKKHSITKERNKV